MEQNVYRSELDRVRFTEEGKSALTEALLAERAAPAEKRHRRPWMKRGVAAALAAVLLVGSAAAVTVSLWDGFFGELMGCTASQVSTYLYRGKAKLRKMLGGAYGQECLSE